MVGLRLPIVTPIRYSAMLKDINVSDIIEGSDLNRARKDFQALLAGRRIKSTEYVASRQDGSTFPIIVFPSVVKRRGRTPDIRGIAIDLTEQKQLGNTARYYQSGLTRNKIIPRRQTP